MAVFSRKNRPRIKNTFLSITVIIVVLHLLETGQLFEGALEPVLKRLVVLLLEGRLHGPDQGHDQGQGLAHGRLVGQEDFDYVQCSGLKDKLKEEIIKK